MNIRRVVTQHDRSGKAVFASDGVAPRAFELKHVPGMSGVLLWETTASTEVGHSATDSTTTSTWVPSAGGTNVMIMNLPPDSVMAKPDFNPMAAGGEYMETLPGLAEKFEMDAPGMHRTDTVDYAVVLDGDVHLELDDGQIKQLKKHEVVVQNGTRHAWRNRSDKPVTLLFVLVGAPRAS